MVFAIAGAGAWYFSKQDKTHDKTERIREGMQFKTNTADVHKIFIAQRDGTTTTFERKDDYWMVNGKHKANPNIMKNMMTTIGGVEVKYIPTKASYENIINEIASIGIKVELYGKSNDLIKTYYVGGSTNDELGTYMIMDGSDQPYVTHIAALEGGLRWRFTPKGETWRDKTLFTALPPEVKSISVEYSKQKDKSFRLEQKGEGNFEVTPLFDFIPKSGNAVNANAVNSYLIGYKNVIAEGFENQSSKRDSILNSEPFSILKFEKSDGTETTVRFFPLGVDERRDITGEYLPVHRYYADVNGEDFMKVQQRVIGKLFWGYEQFFK